MNGVHSQRQRIIVCFAAVLLIVLFLSACAGINQPGLGIKDEKVVRLVKEGAKLYDGGKYEEGLEKFSEAEKQAMLPEDKREIADILFKGGFKLSEMKLFDTALSYYEPSLEINKVLGNKPGLALNYSYIGDIYAKVGKYEDGIRGFQEALQIQKQSGDKIGTSYNLNNAANLYSYLGEYGESIRLLTQALEVSEEIKDPAQTARTLINLGTIYFRLRNYQKSIGHLNRAIEIADGANEENIKAFALNLTGVVNRSQGKYEDALDSYLTALKINKKLRLKTETAVNLSVIGELYKELGRYDEALKRLEESLGMTRRLKDRLMTAVNLSYIGEVKYGQRDYTEARGFYNTSSGMFRELGFKDRIARSFNNIGYLEGDVKNYDAAIRNFDKAIAIYKDLGDREWIRVALFGRGVYSEEKGDPVSAEKNYKEAVDVFESIRQDVSGGEEARQIFSDVNVKVYEKLVSLLIRRGRTEEALEYIRRSRSKSLRDNRLKGGLSSPDDNVRGQLQRHDRLSRREASINDQLRIEKLKPLPNPEKISNLSRTLAETREEFRGVNSRLEKENPGMSVLLGISPLNLLRLREKGKLPENLVVLQYFVTENEIYIFTVGRSEIRVKSVSIEKERLNEMVSDFRRLIFESSTLGAYSLDLSVDDLIRNKRMFDELSTSLYGYLVDPVRGDIEDAETVGIIPFGILNYLPFQALARQKADGRPEFFLEEKGLVYLTDFDQLNAALKNAKAKSFRSAVAFGNPDLKDEKLYLPYSEEEVQGIKEVFPDTLAFLKDQATKENFRNNWGKYRMVHLSAHNSQSDEGQFILLAPAVSGRLSMFDIMGLPQGGAIDFVVLSACSTAIDPFQKNPAGTELAALAFTFMWIKVPSVFATLWDISDQGTAVLMKTFYQNLKDGKSLYAAFRDSQIGMIKGGGKYSHPYYWSSFVLFGDWR